MKHMKRVPGILAVVLALTISLFGTGMAQAISLGPAAEYNPVVNPTDFTKDVTNPYFSIPVGKKMVYEAPTEDGLERIEVLVPGWTRMVMGVETLVFWDRVWLDGQLLEDTRDYLAQHTVTGDLWYFGEHVDNYENGQIKDHAGAWLAGVDGAKPGIWMLANPQVGDEFRNEYYAGEAEDITKILSINETVETPSGTYNGCVKTLDWSPLFKATANKYFCKQVGGTALEVDLKGPETPVEQRTSLASVDLAGALGVTLPSAYASEGVIAAAATTINTNTAVTSSTNAGSKATDNQTTIMVLVVIGLLLIIAVAVVASKRRGPGAPPAS